MQKDNKLFEDMARMASGAAGVVFDAKREMEAMIAAQFENLLAKAGYVKRDEFEVVRKMAQTACEEVAELKKRLDEA